MSSLKDLASLIMIPSLVKDGRLDTVKPLGNSIIHPDATGNNDGTDGSTPAEGNFTFSRGSNLAATRVDVNGLIEKGRENLLTYSQDATQWSSQKSTRVSETEADPFSGNSAAEYAVSSITGGSYFYRTLSPSLSSGQVFTGSIYVKDVDQRYVQLTFGTAAFGSSQYQNFDLQTGTKGTGIGMIDSAITSVGSGWYRLSITAATTSSGASGVVPCFVPSASATRLQAPSVVGQSIQAFGLQLETSLVATDYIETGASTAQSGILEDLPRLDYSGGASCPALLLEPQRTNAVQYSEGGFAFQGSISGTGISPVITENAAISPEGLQNAFRVDLDRGTGNTSGDWSWIYRNGIAYSGENQISVYLKAATNSDIGKEVAIRYGGSASPVTLTADWKRYYVSRTLTATSEIGLYSRGGENADNAVSCFVYGFQVENNSSYPTSYIPTMGSAVTRSNDVADGVTIDTTANHTLLYDFNSTTGREASSGLVNIGYDTANRYFIKGTSASSVEFQVAGIGVFGGSINPTNEVSGRNKIAVQWIDGKGYVYSNGVKLSGTLTNTSSANNINYYKAEGRGYSQEVNQLVIFNTALTDSECIALTTL